MNFNRILYIHFITNFSFYTLKSFLILYLTRHMGLGTSQALLMFGNIMALSYFLTLWNSILADKYFSVIPSLILGIFLLIIGFICIPLFSGDNKILGFTFICLASGFYKPALLAESSRIGEDRPKKAPTYYYAAGNLSTIASGIIAGNIINFFKIEYVFFLLAVILFPVLYISCLSLPKNIQANKILKGLFGASLIGGAIFCSLNNSILLKSALPFMLFGTMVFLLKEKSLRQTNILLALGVFTAFAMFVEMFSGVTTLFIEHHVHRKLGSYIIPTSSFQSISPLILIVLTGLGVLLKRQKTSPSHTSFFNGFLLLTLGIIFLIICNILNPSLQIIFLVAAIFCHTMTELLIVPQTLQMLGQNSQDENRQRTMSLWLGCISAAHILAAHLSGFYFSESSIPNKEEFTTFYLVLGGISLLLCLMMGVIQHFRKEGRLSWK